MSRLSERMLRGEDRPDRTHAVAEIAAIVHPWDVDGDRIMDVIGDARLVLIGDATHGTHEFYRERARLTRRLIMERGFTAIAVEADHSAIRRVDRYVSGVGDDRTADEALAGLRPFPGWLWRNTVVAESVDWLRDHNRDALDAARVRIHGLVDERSGPQPVEIAGRFEPDEFRDDRAMGMAESLLRLTTAPNGVVAGRRIVVWAHNTHVGDSRATDGAGRGDPSLGQVVRERLPGEAVMIGFSTGSGTVTAAPEWGEPPRTWALPPGLPGSWESLFHEVALVGGHPALLIPLRGDVPPSLTDARLQRGIGVVYRPDSERWSHYRRADLARQFDALIHIDTTTALVHLDPEPDPDPDLANDGIPGSGPFLR